MNTTHEDILTRWNRSVMPELHLIALDETEDWNIPEKYQPSIKRIQGVYLYDETLHTHICSFTPSYWLIAVDRNIVFVEETSYDLQEEIWSWMDDAEMIQSDYYNVSDIGHLATRFPDRTIKVSDITLYGRGDRPEDYDTYDDYIESWREFFQANSYL